MGGCASRQSYMYGARCSAFDDRHWSPDGKSGRRYSKREFTKFMFAASNGDLEWVRNFILIRIRGYYPNDLDILDPYGKSALCRAVLGGHRDIVEELLTAGANWEDSYRFDPMMRRRIHDILDTESCSGGTQHDTNVDRLHEHESMYFQKSTFNRSHRSTILHVAVIMHHVEIVQEILSQRYNSIQDVKLILNRRNTFYQRPVDLAFAQNCPECLGFLCRRGADIKEKCQDHSDRETSLLIKAISQGKSGLVKAICTGTVHLLTVPINSPSPLNKAAKLGDEQMVEYLLTRGAQMVTEPTYIDMPTILIPVLKGDVSMTRLMIDMGVSVDDTFALSSCVSDSTLRNIHHLCTRMCHIIQDVSMVNNRHMVSSVTKLIYIAILKAQTGMLKLLLDKGASPHYDYRMRINPSPLMFAIHLNRIEAVRLLLEFDNSQINRTRDNNIFHSLPPLTYAVYRENLEIVGLFFRHGANPNEPSIEYLRLPLHIAASGPGTNLNIIQQLLDHGSSPDFATDLGDNLLHNVIRGHYRSSSMLFDVVLLLLQYGMDLSVQDTDRLNGCWRALIRYDFATCRLLLEAGSPSNNGVRAYLKITANYIQREAEQHPQNYLPPETHILHWFEERLSNPRSLSDICCILIRKRLGRRLPKTVTQLCLPKQLENTLLFKYLIYLRHLFTPGTLECVYNHELWCTS